MVLNKDFREFIALLNEKDVKYLVIGGYAVAYHGYPRYTKDIDFWVWLNPENAQKALDVIAAFGMASMNLTIDDFLNKEAGRPQDKADVRKLREQKKKKK